MKKIYGLLLLCALLVSQGCHRYYVGSTYIKSGGPLKKESDPTFVGTTFVVADPSSDSFTIEVRNLFARTLLYNETKLEYQEMLRSYFMPMHSDCFMCGDKCDFLIPLDSIGIGLVIDLIMSPFSTDERYCSAKFDNTVLTNPKPDLSTLEERAAARERIEMHIPEIEYTTSLLTSIDGKIVLPLRKIIAKTSRPVTLQLVAKETYGTRTFHIVLNR